MSTRLRTAFRVLVPWLIVSSGGLALASMIATKPQAERNDRKAQGLLVRTTRATSDTPKLSVQGQGTVTAAQEVDLIAQVSGRVVWISDELERGGVFEKGDPIARIDPSDYQLSVDARVASLKQAELELELERGRRVVAEHEWDVFRGERETELGEDARRLALRGPQLDTAEVAIQAAESDLARARLDLSRTTIRAPFNATVVSEQVELGQVVSGQNPIATLIGTDAYWVQVAVPADQLPYVNLPTRTEPGAEATIDQSLGSDTRTHLGRVIRLLPDLDAVGRMARLLVEIEDPLGLAQGDARDRSAIPLLIGSYVDVSIAIAPFQDAVEIPRMALREGSKVYVVGDDRRLDVRSVRLAWRLPETVLVHEGLSGRELVVTSRIATPVQGMQLRVAETTGRDAESSTAVQLEK
ncbi:MAG: efflux RND transporter periplasmic adaptor subunit [Myxococcota bacterium]